ncbi:MAG: hypothetical protein MUP85_16490 [Candidatus Lokiarchaeota archaeon]|nr:hypothetical protein [Candidatus Lokiarchaeota archaeon]
MKVCQVNNSVTFSGKTIKSDDFLIQIVETLGIAVDICPKRRSRKKDN